MTEVVLEPNAVKTTFLELEGMPIFGLPTEHELLMVRDCYHTLLL